MDPLLQKTPRKKKK
jgi:hypothetical protein